MDEKSVDPLELKKKILFPHLDFVKEMLVKVKGKSIEEKWKIMYECITSDKKRPSYEKIKQMEKTLIALKSQSKQKSNVPQSHLLPSTSKATTENIERDPRKQIPLDQSSSVIYNFKQRDEYRSSSLSPGLNDNHSTRFQSKVESETRSGHCSKRYNNFSRHNDKVDRNYQESFRGRGMYSRGRPFSRHSYDNDSRFRSNQRSTISFNDKPRFRDERSQSSFRDDLKRKRSQSPESYISRQKLKRSSYNQPNEHKESKVVEKFKRLSSTGSKYSTDESDCKNDQRDKTTSKIETKVVCNDDKTPIPEKKEAELPVNFSEAIKKIQRIEITKRSMNESTSKTEVPKKDIVNSKDSVILNLENTLTRETTDQELKNSIKDVENELKIVETSMNQNKSIDLKIAIDKIKAVTAKNKCETNKNTEFDEQMAATNLESNKLSVKIQDVDNKTMNIENRPETSKNCEIKEKLESKEVIQEIDKTKPPTNLTDQQNVNEIESKTNDKTEAEEKNSEFKTAEVVENESFEETNEKSTDTEEISTNPIKNDTNHLKEIEFKKQDEIKNDQIDQFTGSTSVDISKAEVNVTDEHKRINKQDELTSCSSKNVSIPKASVLTNLLENEEEDPEKVLEGLISVLGAEKVKKMQELLLKKTIKSENALKCQKEENFNSKADKNEVEDVDDKKITLGEIKTVNDEKTSLNTADIMFDCKNSEDIDDTNKTEFVPKPDIQPTSNTNLVKKSSINSSPEKIGKKKPRKKKLTELDKLHENILSSIDCEGIMRACAQPRVSIKPKNFEVCNSTNKNQETKSFTLKILRLNLTSDDMPIVLNDEFYKKYMTIQETKSRTKPKPRKKRTISQGKPSMKVMKTEREFETVPSTPLHNTEIPVEGMQISAQPLNEIKIENSLKPELKTFRATNLKKKKKQKLPSWSKGILKKKPKRFRLSSIYEWEDVDSSDDNTTFDRTMKLKKFKNLLDDFAKKCGYKKISNKSDVHTTLDTVNQKINNSVPKDLSGTLDGVDMAKDIDKSTVNEVDTKLVVPKRINLPLEENVLTMITNNHSSEIKSPTNIPESSSLKITINLPTVEKSVQSILPIIQQTQQSDVLIDGSSNGTNTKIYSSQNNPQKVVIVKPLSKETQIETVRVRSLSAQEQQTLKDSLSSTKNQTPASSIDQQNDKIIKNIKTNVNTSLHITKISTHNPPNVATSKKETVKKSLPMISNVESISQKGSTEQDSSNKEQTEIPKIISFKSIADSPKIQENVSGNFSESFTFPTSENELGLGKPESIETSTSNNEPVEIVDLIDDDDDDDVVDIMRPWIEQSEYKSRKDQIEAIKMINNAHCLASLYKCMGSTCSYFSNDKSLFQKHLELHRDHQKTDSQNYLLCCYCSFRPKSINVLLVHIENAHSYGKFGCRYCFYRSINEYQVTANHHSNFHRLKEKCVVVFEPKKIKNENIEKSMISESIPKVCHPLPCPYCRIGIYTIAEFEAHVSSHKENFKTVCTKCNQTTNKLNISQHLLKCFNKFGNYQCVFCVFGSNIFSAIDNHLASEHPDKLSYFAERCLNTGKDPTSKESLTTKELSKRITGNVKKMHLRYPFNDEAYKNSGNVGRLAENLIIDIKAGPSTSENSCFLQIGEVVSLHD